MKPQERSSGGLSKRSNRTERRALAERILRDRKLLDDFVHHALIEKAKRVRGKEITLSEYEATKASKVACQPLYTVVLKPSAQRDLKKLAKSNHDRVLMSLHELENDPRDQGALVSGTG